MHDKSRNYEKCLTESLKFSCQYWFRNKASYISPVKESLCPTLGKNGRLFSGSLIHLQGDQIVAVLQSCGCSLYDFWFGPIPLAVLCSYLAFTTKVSP